MFTETRCNFVLCTHFADNTKSHALLIQIIVLGQCLALLKAISTPGIKNGMLTPGWANLFSSMVASIHSTRPCCLLLRHMCMYIYLHVFDPTYIGHQNFCISCFTVSCSDMMALNNSTSNLTSLPFALTGRCMCMCHSTCRPHARFSSDHCFLVSGRGSTSALSSSSFNAAVASEPMYAIAAPVNANASAICHQVSDNASPPPMNAALPT